MLVEWVAGSGSFFNHRQDLDRLHVEHLGDSPLHDKEVWIVDVQLNRLEKILYCLLLCAVAINEIFRSSA